MQGNFSFHNPTRLHFGKESLAKLRDELQNYGPKVMLTYGGGSIKKNGIYDQVVAGAATPETIRELLTITSPEHLLYGTDYPYVKAPILIRNLSTLKNNLEEILPQNVDQILQKNAVKLFYY